LINCVCRPGHLYMQVHSALKMHPQMGGLGAALPCAWAHAALQLPLHRAACPPASRALAPVSPCLLPPCITPVPCSCAAGEAGSGGRF
jgi:hypothetical protein